MKNINSKFSILVCLSLFCAMGYAKADGFSGWLFSLTHRHGVQAVHNATYLEECGACHYAYPPGLLPQASWDKLLTNQALKNHFNENAELPTDKLTVIRDYALSQSADQSYYKLSRKVMAAVAPGETPLRITELRFIRRKHHDIPRSMVQDNAKVKSLSNCNACHRGANEGLFDEDAAAIPNYPDYR